MPKRHASATCSSPSAAVGAGVALGRDDHLPRPLEEAAVVERLDEHQPGVAVGVHRGLTVHRLPEVAKELLGLNELTAGGDRVGVRRGDQQVEHRILHAKRPRLLDDAKRFVCLAPHREVVPGSNEEAHGPFGLRRGNLEGDRPQRAGPSRRAPSASASRASSSSSPANTVASSLLARISSKPPRCDHVANLERGSRGGEQASCTALASRRELGRAPKCPRAAGASGRPRCKRFEIVGERRVGCGRCEGAMARLVGSDGKRVCELGVHVPPLVAPGAREYERAEQRVAELELTRSNTDEVMPPQFLDRLAAACSGGDQVCASRGVECCREQSLARHLAQRVNARAEEQLGDGLRAVADISVSCELDERKCIPRGSLDDRVRCAARGGALPPVERGKLEPMEPVELNRGRGRLTHRQKRRGPRVVQTACGE